MPEKSYGTDAGGWQAAKSKTNAPVFIAFFALFANWYDQYFRFNRFMNCMDSINFPFNILLFPDLVLTSLLFLKPYFLVGNLSTKTTPIFPNHITLLYSTFLK